MRFAWVRAAVLVSGLVSALALASCGRGSAAPATDDATAKASADFMAKNAGAPGVIALPSGLQYKVVQSGPSGSPSPDRNDLVKVDYEGTLIDGTVFDSSFERGVPYVTTPEEVVPGWTEALQRMKVGDEWILYIPAALGYGDRSSPEIPANSALVFRVKLLDMAPTPGGGRGVGTANG